MARSTPLQETAMVQNQALRDDLCHKLRLVGLSKEVVLPLVNSLERQVRAEGPENVVRRLKDLKLAALQFVAGGEFSLPWIAHNQHGPKGPWRPVWSMLSSASYKQKKRALNAVMVYAAFSFKERASPTPAQEKKFLGSVEQPDIRVKTVTEAASRLMETTTWTKAVGQLSRLAPLGGKPETVDYKEFVAKRAGLDKRKMVQAEHTMFKFLGQDWGRVFHPFPEVQETLGYDLVDRYSELQHPWDWFSQPWEDAEPGEEPIGVVGSSQEPGLKFRAFASPCLVLQAALEPLKVQLLSVLKKLPWDCTHDQNKGVMGVQEWLKQGRTVYSVDLSDATNNFPLGLQLDVLRKLRGGSSIPPSTIRLFELVCRSPYKLLWDNPKQEVVWNVGQPLGAGPSFMAFALTHAATVLCAELRSGISPKDLGRTFYVLGDDVVISDTQVHAEYRGILEELSIPVSESKCLISTKAAEFAGKLVTSDRVFHGFKYKDLNDISFLDVVRSLGSQAISRELLTEEQYHVARALREVPEPWGLGFNPKGIPYAQRYEMFLTLKERFFASKPDLPTMDRDRLINNLLYSWGNPRRKPNGQWEKVSETGRAFWETFPVDEHPNSVVVKTYRPEVTPEVILRIPDPTSKTMPFSEKVLVTFTGVVKPVPVTDVNRGDPRVRSPSELASKLVADFSRVRNMLQGIEPKDEDPWERKPVSPSPPLSGSIESGLESPTSEDVYIALIGDASEEPDPERDVSVSGGGETPSDEEDSWLTPR